MPKNYLITGLPRSGTTLLASVLSENMEAVTFSEPEWLKEIRANSSECGEFANAFANKIFALRSDIKNSEPIYIKTSRFNKGLPENYYRRNQSGEVVVDKDESPIVFPKEYANKAFIIKANAQFTACLKELIKYEDYKIVCMVRNPVSVIMSWRSLDLPVSRGNMKVAEKYNNDFESEISAKSLIDKQVKIVDWFFKQFYIYRNQLNLIYYEDLINNTSEVICSITKSKLKAFKKLESKNLNKHYDLKEQEFISERIKAIGSYTLKHYDLNS